MKTLSNEVLMYIYGSNANQNISPPPTTYVPNTNILIGSVAGGAIAGALGGIPAGPIGMVGGAIAGAALAGATVSISDAMEINDSMKG